MSVRFPVAFGSAWVRLALLAAAALGLGGFVIVARARLTSPITSAASAPAQDQAASPHQTGRPETRITSHPLTLRPRGFDQAEVSWPKGRFFIMIDNRTNVSELNLQLDREVGGRVKEAKLKMRKERSLGVFDMTPGVYLLTEASHPGWACRITITPQ
jgi:hypothetical protein